MKIEEAINKFLEFLIKELNYSEQTKESYARDLRDYQDFLVTHQMDYLQMNKADVLRYLKYLDYHKL